MLTDRFPQNNETGFDGLVSLEIQLEIYLYKHIEIVPVFPCYIDGHVYSAQIGGGKFEGLG